MSRTLYCTLCTTALASAVALCNEASAQRYPTKPVRMIVANTPGGGADTIARIVADVLTVALGQQVVVENRGGAGGRIGMEAAARSAPDGYTLVLGTGSNLATVPALYSKLSYRPLKDFAPVSLAATTSYMLVAHPSVPANTARELVNLRQTRAGGLNYASTGPGTFSHLGGELMKSLAGLKATHVAYKGSAAATLSLVQGETDVMFSNFIASLSLVRAKRLRTLGVTSLKRSAVVPDVPTIDESGIRGFQMQQSYSLWAPAGTSAEIIGRLNEEVTRRLPAVDAQKTLAADGTELTVSSPKALEKLIIDETAKWSAVVEKAGIRVEQ